MVVAGSPSMNVKTNLSKINAIGSRIKRITYQLYVIPFQRLSWPYANRISPQADRACVFSSVLIEFKRNKERSDHRIVTVAVLILYPVDISQELINVFKTRCVP